MREVPVGAPAAAADADARNGGGGGGGGGVGAAAAALGGVAGGGCPPLGGGDAGGGCPPLGGGAVGPDWLSGRDSRYGAAAKRPRLVGAAGAGAGASDGGSLRIFPNTEVVGAAWDGAAAAAGAPPLRLRLSTGDAVAVDWVVAATGVTPATELAVAAGIAVDGVGGGTADAGGGAGGGRAGMVGAATAGAPPPAPTATAAAEAAAAAAPHPCPGGILVRAPSLATSAARVFAAGDCTTVVVPPGGAGLWHQMRLWGQARVAGAVAARSALAAATGGGDGAGAVDGDSVDDDADLSFELFAHVTWFMGAKVVLLGRYGGQGLPAGYTVYEADGADGGEGGPGAWARAVVGPTGRLVGGVLVGETGLEEAYENLMLDGLDVRGVGARLVAGGGVDLADYFD